MAKTKTQIHKGEKIHLVYDYTIDYITLTVKFENQKELRFWNKQVDKLTNKKSDAPAAVVESKEIVEEQPVTTEA